jgi:hypothetical protein
MCGKALPFRQAKTLKWATPVNSLRGNALAFLIAKTGGSEAAGVARKNLTSPGKAQPFRTSGRQSRDKKEKFGITENEK